MSEDRFVLDPDERRVVGVLIEKSLCTPQYYPMTINAIVAGSNQKSNRSPLVEFVEDEVDEILLRLQRRGLASEHYGAGGRAARWRQELTKELELDGRQMAVIGELLLRGPQTVGELRTRASRMKEIPDLDALESVLASLESHSPPRIVRLSPPDQKRGVRVTHGFYPASELREVRLAEGSSVVAAPAVVHPAVARPASAPPPAHTTAATSPDLTAALAPAAATVPPVPPSVLAELREEIATLKRRVEHLEEQLGIATQG